MLLHVSEETRFCVSGRIRGDYVLCYCTYLRRIYSVFLDVSVKTMLYVSGRI